MVVVGTNFKMTCQEMTVYFTTDNKVDTIVATGDVIITQPDRVTHCGRADYFHDEDKFILTDQPVIHDHKTCYRPENCDLPDLPKDDVEEALQIVTSATAAWARPRCPTTTTTDINEA